MIDAGLIGFGLGGKAFHAPVIAAVEDLRLAAVLQRHENTAAEIYPGVKIVRTVEEMLSNESIKLVAISTPNDTHFSYVKACLEADRHVVVDKPFTTTLAEAKELAELARKRGRLLTVYQERRLDGDFETLKKLIANGELGRPVHYEETFDRCRALVRDSWKEKVGPGCGVFWDLAPHLIDHDIPLAVLARAGDQSEEWLSGGDYKGKSCWVTSNAQVPNRSANGAVNSSGSTGKWETGWAS